MVSIIKKDSPGSSTTITPESAKGEFQDSWKNGKRINDWGSCVSVETNDLKAIIDRVDPARYKVVVSKYVLLSQNTLMLVVADSNDLLLDENRMILVSNGFEFPQFKGTFDINDIKGGHAEEKDPFKDPPQEWHWSQYNGLKTFKDTMDFY
ncbi:MAG: hypothetical protein KDD63_21300, partial [Bacteroidetes bacterium]|nr:hypothetical protein [Bacteroidota bacterium]